MAEYRTDPKSPTLQLLIARLTISEQHYSLGVAKTSNGVLQHLKDGFAGSDQLFVPHPSGERHHQPSCRSYYFGLPELLALTPSEAPAFIGLQAGAGQLLDPLVVEPQGRIRWIGNGTGLALTDLTVPYPKSPSLWGVLTFAELSCTAPAADPANPSLVTDLVRSVGLADSEVALSWLAVIGALMIDAG